jgi:hypothetical protein
MNDYMPHRYGNRLSVGENIFWRATNGGCESSAEVKLRFMTCLYPQLLPQRRWQNDYFRISENESVELIIFNRQGMRSLPIAII